MVTLVTIVISIEITEI